MKNWNILVFIGLGLALMVFAVMYGDRPGRPDGVAEISYSDFRKHIDKQLVAKVRFLDSEARGEFLKPQPLGREGADVTKFTTQVPPFGDAELLKKLDERGVSYEFAPRKDGTSIQNVLIGILPWLLIIGFYIWMSRRMSQNMGGGMGGGGGGFRDFLEGPSQREQKDQEPVTFDDVAGQESAKREVSELVEYLQDPDRFTRLGAEVPHGVLLMGPPGTGKTLLARALAGEAEVPFFSISASEFIEVFVGVGASRVRHMFEQARKRAPSIIFIDELDSIGRVRGTGLGGGHDEREQTLNQILAEMDGFGGHEAVVVVAATNRPDVLDPALLRPGRFDRHITLDLPDQKARAAILKVHVRKVPLADDVDLDLIASGTPGFSGADLKNLVNEAAIMAAREEGKDVTAAHFETARDRVIMGSERHFIITEDERHRLAVHESGHTAVGYFLPYADPIHKVTIIPRGQALGATFQLPEEERHTLPEEYLKDRLAILLGGRAAEKALLDSISSGADDDIKQATALARAMVSRWGMSKDVGPMDVRDSEEHPFLGREIAQPRRFSETTAHMVDQAVHDLLADAERRANDVLEHYRPQMLTLIAKLEEKETLDHDDIGQVLGPRRDAATG